MSKSILVIGTPECCAECQFARWPVKGDGDCFALHKEQNIKIPEIYLYENLGKPNWCPLKSFPDKLEQSAGITYWNGVIDGWNQCIDEITGGEIDGEINT